MSEESTSTETVKNLGWRVTFAGLGINMALGILYTWSVISKRIPEEWGWNENDKSLPYMFACLVFSLIMVLAGRMQDKIGPRIVATLGGILVGVGFIVAASTTSLAGFVTGFGILAGAGIGFGYASATPAAVKWFPPAKTGLIAGIVVSGFGLASVYAAPLAKWLMVTYGFKTMLLTIPVGEDTIYYPLHRIYGSQRLPRLLKGWNIIKEEYWMKDNHNLWIQAEKEKAVNLITKEHYYGLGLFVLELP